MASLLERATLLSQAANNPTLQAALIEKCRRDCAYFINTFCWTYDPRNGGKLPFNLYPFQETLIQDLLSAIYGNDGKKIDLLIEKSRDMGVSWIVLVVFVWCWRFKENANFLCGSRKQDYVDTLGDISTLFPKIRYTIQWLPGWMLPKGFDARKHDCFMKLINPENGNTITGESTNPDFARGGRYNAVLFDEFPKWQFGNAAWGSAYQSTPCRIVVGTPYGKGNKFAQLRFSRDGSNIKVMSIHWRLHPMKDEAWYKGECERASKDEIARELDISYEMSIGGIVFKEMVPSLHIVKGSYKWQRYGRNLAGFDFGTTCANLNCQLDDNGTLHVAKEIILYQNGNTDDLAQAFISFASSLDLDKDWEFTCDPAGVAKVGKEKDESTHIQRLELAGIKPMEYEKAKRMQCRLVEGIQLIKTLLSTRFQGIERIQIYEDGCPILIEAFQSEYRYKENANGELTDIVDQKHPWEDIMDCLRYIIIQWLSGIDTKRKVQKATSVYKSRNPYTGYRA